MVWTVANEPEPNEGATRMNTAAQSTPPTIRTPSARPEAENEPLAAIYLSIRGSLANALVAAARVAS